MFMTYEATGHMGAIISRIMYECVGGLVGVSGRIRQAFCRDWRIWLRDDDTLYWGIGFGQFRIVLLARIRYNYSRGI